MAETSTEYAGRVQADLWAHLKSDHRLEFKLTDLGLLQEAIQKEHWLNGGREGVEAFLQEAANFAIGEIDPRVLERFDRIGQDTHSESMFQSLAQIRQNQAYATALFGKIKSVHLVSQDFSTLDFIKFEDEVGGTADVLRHGGFLALAMLIGELRADPEHRSIWKPCRDNLIERYGQYFDMDLLSAVRVSVAPVEPERGEATTTLAAAFAGSTMASASVTTASLTPEDPVLSQIRDARRGLEGLGITVVDPDSVLTLSEWQALLNLASNLSPWQRAFIGTIKRETGKEAKDQIIDYEPASKTFTIYTGLFDDKVLGGVYPDFVSEGRAARLVKVLAFEVGRLVSEEVARVDLERLKGEFKRIQELIAKDKSEALKTSYAVEEVKAQNGQIETTLRSQWALINGWGSKIHNTESLLEDTGDPYKRQLTLAECQGHEEGRKILAAIPLRGEGSENPLDHTKKSGPQWNLPKKSRQFVVPLDDEKEWNAKIDTGGPLYFLHVTFATWATEPASFKEKAKKDKTGRLAKQFKLMDSLKTRPKNAS